MRKVYFEELDSYEPTPIFERSFLGGGAELHGPSIVEDMDTTIVLRPGQTGRVDDFGNMIIDLR